MKIKIRKQGVAFGPNKTGGKNVFQLAGDKRRKSKAAQHTNRSDAAALRKDSPKKFRRLVQLKAAGFSPRRAEKAGDFWLAHDLRLVALIA